ncbi:tyrosine-type recombinase/integrase [bacterium]|nr:tyrosine-type recombinase/integrase [bacterium]
MEWRVIWSLARWGGLRTPSETFALTWADIDFEKGRMHVRSIKTEHIAGHESRIVPLFPEVRSVLDELAERDQPGIEIPLSASVVGKGRGVETNLRTTFRKIVKRAGLPEIPKAFINARSTRATELAEQFPGHVAAAWLGHSEQIADRHYRQVTDSHYQQAVQNPVQTVSEQWRTGGKRKSGPSRNPGDSASFPRITDHKYPRVDSNH